MVQHSPNRIKGAPGSVVLRMAGCRVRGSLLVGANCYNCLGAWIPVNSTRHKCSLGAVTRLAQVAGWRPGFKAPPGWPNKLVQDQRDIPP